MEKKKRKFKLSGVAIFNIIVGLMTAVLLVYFIVSDGGIIDLLKSDEAIIWWLLEPRQILAVSQCSFT